MTSSSVVAEKSRYHSPTATKPGGWRGQTHVVGERRQLGHGVGRADRYGDDDLRRAGRPHGADGGAHRRTGGEPVVDEHDHGAGEVGRRAVAPQAAVALGELAPGDLDARRDLCRAQAEPGDEVVVAHDQPARRHRADRQLDVAGRADLAHGEHVERRAEPVRHLGGHGDPTAGQPEHDDPSGPGDAAGRPRRRAPGRPRSASGTATTSC